MVPWRSLGDGGPDPRSKNALAELRDPARRPAQPYEPLDPALLEFQPEVPVTLSAHTLLANLRRARKGAAAGPSGDCAALMTKHLVLLSSEQPLNSHGRRFPPASPQPLALAASWRCRSQMAVSGPLWSVTSFVG